MKLKILASILIFLGMLSAEKVHAQKNVIKTNIPGWAIRNLNIGYERAIGTRFSIQVSGSYLWPIRMNIGQYFFPADSPFYIKPKIDAIFVTPEFRYFPSDLKESPAGFYIAPWLRYFRYRMKTDYAYEMDSSITHANATITYGSFGIGINFGFQWIVKNHLSIDIFGGAGVGGGTFGVKVKDEILTPDDYEEIAKAIGQVNFRFPGFNVYYRNDEAGLTVPIGPIPMVRAGLAIGFAF